MCHEIAEDLQSHRTLPELTSTSVEGPSTWPLETYAARFVLKVLLYSYDPANNGRWADRANITQTINDVLLILQGLLRRDYHIRVPE